MQYLVVSDIHGSALAAETIVKKFKETGSDKILLLGDILYHGPRNLFPDEYNPARVTEVLNGVADKIIAVKGNCDAEIDEMVLNFPLNDSVIIDFGERSVFCTHGQHISPEKPAKLSKGTVVLYGHFHRIGRTEVDGVSYINVGSIALPKHETPKSYSLLTESELKVFDVSDKLYETFKF